MCQRWEQWPLKLACSVDCRHPKHLVACAAQFDIENNARYKPENGCTYCNVAATDITRALECEIPHWVSTTGAKCAVGKGRELTALGMIGWLRVYGSDNGWTPVTDPYEANGHAAAGRPVVVTWENPGKYPDGRRKPSHIAVLLPPVDGETRIVQAGAQCLFNAPIAKGFGNVKPLEYWTHP